MSGTDDIVRANTQYAQDFDRGDLPAPPGKHLAVVTCMDARLHPVLFLGISPGDAHVISNAGGRVSEDALRSLIISSQLLGTNEFVIIHHTDCGMLSFTNDDLRNKLKEETGADASNIDFLPIAELEDSVREDIQKVRESPYLDRGITVRGFVYDVRTGKLQEVT